MRLAVRMAAVVLFAALGGGQSAAAQNATSTGLDGEYDENNPFAGILRGELPRSPVLETDQLLVIVPLSQASRGHLLVIPKCACRTLTEVPAEQLTAVMTTLQRLMAAERLAYNPDGFNIRQNNGAAARQTVFHVHFHLVPRYEGQALLAEDANVLSRDAMDTAAAEVRAALAELR